MLSDEAEAISMPGLGDSSDDVRCTHGATSGEIDEEELFYMEARGIRKSDGRRLIVNGFFRSLLERLNQGRFARTWRDGQQEARRFIRLSWATVIIGRVRSPTPSATTHLIWPHGAALFFAKWRCDPGRRRHLLDGHFHCSRSCEAVHLEAGLLNT